MLLSSKHIFLVEDNHKNAAIMTTALQMEGAKTYFDRWAKDTVQRLKSISRIDIILMDLHLANNMSGYDVFDAIQAEPDLANIPVVVVSASDATLELNKARDKGFAGYIQKPIDLNSFAKLIAAVLDGKAVWADEFI